MAIPVLLTVQVRERTEKITAVTFTQEGKTLYAAIVTSSVNFGCKAFSLVSPDWIVVDVYWEEMPSTPYAVRKSAVPATAVQSAIGPAPELRLLPSFSRFNTLHLYILIVLIVSNFITLLILAVLSVALTKRGHDSTLAGHAEIEDSLMTADDSVILINSRVQEEFRKYKNL